MRLIRTEDAAGHGQGPGGVGPGGDRGIRRRRHGNGDGNRGQAA